MSSASLSRRGTQQLLGEDNVPKRPTQSKVRDRLIGLLSASGVQVGLPRSSSTQVIFSQSSTDLVPPQDPSCQQQQPSSSTTSTLLQPSATSQLANNNSAANQSAYSSTERIASQPHPDELLERMSSSSLTPMATAASGELSSLRTTDSFPRVFKEFDFLEAEHDTISESTDSCFNWLSTMRSPRCTTADGDEDAQAWGDDAAGDEHDDDFIDGNADEYGDEDEDNDSIELELPAAASALKKKKAIDKCASTVKSASTSTSASASVFKTRGSDAIKESRRGSRGRMVAGGAGGSGALRKVRRPLSRASDSNDVSSDRTPVQSTKHSDDESCPSCPFSEDDEDDIAEEEGEYEDDDAVATAEEQQPQPPQQQQLQYQQKLPFNQQQPTFGTSAAAPKNLTKKKQRAGAEGGLFARRQTPQSSVASSSPNTSPAHSSNAYPKQQIDATTATAISAATAAVPAAATAAAAGDDPLMTAVESASSIFRFRSDSLSTTPQQRLTAARVAQWQMANIAAANANNSAAAVAAVVRPLPLECSHHVSGQESSVRVSGLLRDATHLMTTRLRPAGDTLDVSTSLANSLNAVLRVSDCCPFLYVTAQFLRSSSLLQAHKFSFYELGEHFEMFSERREQCIRALNSVKSSTRLLLIAGGDPPSTASSASILAQMPAAVSAASLSGTPNSTLSHHHAAIQGCHRPAAIVAQQLHQQQQQQSMINVRNQEVLLCKSLHKLFFQLLLMLEKLLEMVHSVRQSTNSHEFDLSPAVACLHRDLLNYLSSADPMPSPTDQSGTSVATTASARQLQQTGSGPDLEHSSDSLVLQLTNRQFAQALARLHQLRAQYGVGGGASSAEFGCCEHTDAEVLLVRFCRSHGALRTWALVGSLQSLAQSCAQLKETNMQLAQLVRTLMTAAQAETGGGGGDIHHLATATATTSSSNNNNNGNNFGGTPCGGGGGSISGYSMLSAGER